jgi:predicted glycoside hydrolase/deacetylase ChbG (UPF0249 family)
MATRCNVGIRELDGSLSSIYVHHDGYPEGVGRTLLTHHASEEAARRLVVQGDASFIGATLNECDFYCRDRGEELVIRTYAPGKSIAEHSYAYVWDVAEARWLWEGRGAFEGLRELTPGDCE